MKQFWTEKFKDNTPKETIKNIKDFFSKYNYKIIEEKIFYVKEANTYWCSLCLYKDNNLILTSNGKGSSQDMALASGYGELYERYTSMFEIVSNPFLLSDFIKINYKKYNYFINPFEKILLEEDIINNKKYQQYFQNWFLQDKEKIKNFINLVNGGTILGIPFSNINNLKDIVYENIPMLNRLLGTTGYAAGNTVEEALIQGSAEYFERLVQQKILSASKLNLYKISIDSSVINKENKKIIKTIMKNNYNVIIYDLSYTYNLPVVMVCLFNLYKYKIDFKLGAHFDFNIALERCLTELFQGYATNNNYNIILQKVINDTNANEAIVKSFISKDLADTINPQIFLNNIETDKYNTQIFLNAQNNLKYYQKLKEILRLNNYNLYYRIIKPSQTDFQLYTIQCFIDDNFPIEPSSFQTANLNEEDKEYYYNFFLNYYFLVDTLRKEPQNFVVIKKFMSNLKKLSNRININNIVGLCGYDFLSTYKNNYYIDNILKILNDIKINTLYFLTPNIEEILKFNFLRELKKDSLSTQEIQHIWKNFLPEDIQYYQDIYYCEDDMYTILRSFFIPYLNEINSSKYKSFLIDYTNSMQ